MAHNFRKQLTELNETVKIRETPAEFFKRLGLPEDPNIMTLSKCRVRDPNRLILIYVLVVENATFFVPIEVQLFKVIDNPN